MARVSAWSFIFLHLTRAAAPTFSCYAPLLAVSGCGWTARLARACVYSGPPGVKFDRGDSQARGVGGI